MPTEATGLGGTLTDGTGVSSLTLPKFIKDALLDFLLTAPAVFVALGFVNLDQALTAPTAVGLGLLDAAIRVVYRAALRWLAPAA